MFQSSFEKYRFIIDIKLFSYLCYNICTLKEMGQYVMKEGREEWFFRSHSTA